MCVNLRDFWEQTGFRTTRPGAVLFLCWASSGHPNYQAVHISTVTFGFHLTSDSGHHWLMASFLHGLVQVEQFFRHRMYKIELFWGSGAGCVSFHQKMHTRFSEFPSSQPQVRNSDKTLHIYVMDLGEFRVIRRRHGIPSLLSIKGMSRIRSLCLCSIFQKPFISQLF